MYVFTYTGADQILLVPEGATSMTIHTWGAGGCNDAPADTGLIKGGVGGVAQSIPRSLAAMAQAMPAYAGESGEVISHAMIGSSGGEMLREAPVLSKTMLETPATAQNIGHWVQRQMGGQKRREYETMPAALEAAQAKTDPGDTVEVTTPEEVIARRLDPTSAPAPETSPDPAPEAETDLFGDPIPTEVEPSNLANLAIVEVPVAEITLSQDVPQFKRDADTETGVVDPLGGKFERLGTGPILLWERLNGRREVISGRHRLDLARRSGEATIPSQIVREADGFTLDMAITADAELKIRDEKGTISDFALFFRGSEITREAAESRGLLGRSPGRDGWSIGREGSAALFELHQNSKIGDKAAAAIARAAPGDEALQRVGMQAVLDGQSIEVAVNMMRAARAAMTDAQIAGRQLDLFGADDSALETMRSQAKAAAAIQRNLRDQINAVKGAVKRPETARKLGVDVADPAAVQQRIDTLQGELDRWENWPLHPDLVAQTRQPPPKGVREDPPDFRLEPQTEAQVKAERAAAERREALEKARAAKQAADERRARSATGDLGQGALWTGDGDLFSGPSAESQNRLTPEQKSALAPDSVTQYTISRGADPTNPDTVAAQASLVGGLRTVLEGSDYRQDLLSFGPPVGHPAAGTGGTGVSVRPRRGLDRDAEAARYQALQQGRPDFSQGDTITSVMAGMVEGTFPAWNVVGKVVRTARDFALLMMPLRTPLFESVKVAVLDARNRILHAEVVAIGAIDYAEIEVDDILRVTERAGLRPGQPRRIIVSHNHPSGVPTPSGADRGLQNYLERRAALAGIQVEDHVITDGETFYSLKDNREGRIDAALAPWEAVGTNQRVRLDSSDKTTAMVQTLRQGPTSFTTIP